MVQVGSDIGCPRRIRATPCRFPSDAGRWKWRRVPGATPTRRSRTVSDRRFEVRHEPERSRYVLLDGQAKIGEERYLDVDGADRPERILHHTLVTEEYE